MRQMFSIIVPALLVLICFQHSDARVLNNTISADHLEVAQKETTDSKITLEGILERHYEAKGGKEAWDSVNTLKFTGNMYAKEATFKTAAVYKRPDMCRLDFQAGRLYFMESYNGEIAWQMNPADNKGPQILKGKRAKEMVDTCDFEGPLVDHKKKGHKIKYLGEKESDGRSAYVLQVTLETGNIDTYYLDTKTYLPFMVKGSTTLQDQTVNTTVKVGEYIETGDIVIPFSYEFIVDGSSSPETLKITTIELNKDMDDNIFGLPKRPQDLR